ncbi:MAG: hypothetical protein PHV30_10555, partial [Candidatus Margulisbacteria bacterium]|nr:hypothetical protein [Candidatus Margulisiibacteriota bacterium]
MLHKKQTKKRLLPLITLISLFFLTGITLAGAPICINVSTSVTFSTIKEALASANDNQPILFIQSGTFSGTDNINLEWPNKQNVTLVASPNGSVVLDAKHLTRHFIQHNAVTWNLIGLALINGTADVGGSIYIDAIGPSHNLFFEYGTISGNTASDKGGAVYSTDNAANIYFGESTIQGNSAYGTGTGGGGFGSHGTFYIRNCTVQNNLGYGGVVHSSAVWSSNTMFQNNKTNSSGSGGVFSFSSVTLNNCTFNNNVADTDGGVFFACDTWLTDFAVISNSAGSRGGVFGGMGHTNIMRRGYFSGNSAGQYGGVFYYGTNWLQNSTVYGNKAPQGGAFFSGTNNIINCLIVSNDAAGGAGQGAALYQGDNLLMNSTLAKNCPNNFYVSNDGSNPVGQMEAYNSIFVGETVSGDISLFNTITLSYCSVMPGNLGSAVVNNAINGFNLNGFLDFPNNDYRLTKNAVVINAGNNAIWDYA